ncbi:MAG: hydrogenase nickel incorporation protein HypB [Actinomycetota bacterium]
MGRFHRHPDGTVHEHEAHHHDGDDPVVTAVPGASRDVGDHSGYETGRERVIVLEQILGENDRLADDNRAILAGHGITSVNVMSSPGAGKTSLLARTLPALRDHLRVGVVEGDIASSIDADVLSDLGAQVALVNTSVGFGGECHLDAVMVRAGLGRLRLDELDLIIIENVGNLVCPAEFDVGQDARVIVYAITEGEDKPLKYPVMFRAADIVVVNKIDLLPHLRFDLQAFRANLEQINQAATVIELSAETGEGVEAWIDWLVSEVAAGPRTATATRDATGHEPAG